jgi:hypothetical protein
MLREFEFFHGVVLARILHSSDGMVNISRFAHEFNAGYILNGSIGIYIKHCNKRLTPWRFSFQPEHLKQLQQMNDVIGNLIVVLVCKDDGIACLSYDEVRKILNSQTEATKSIQLSRRRRHKYSVAGSDGKLAFKIGSDDFIEKLGLAPVSIATQKPDEQLLYEDECEKIEEDKEEQY